MYQQAAPRPIFVATHPRACSTAFERVFMTQRDSLRCEHEPFGDAFYYGPERLSERFADDEKARRESGFAGTTYKDVLDRLEPKDSDENRRVFVKDIAYYLSPPNGAPARPAPSLVAASSSSQKDRPSGTPLPTHDRPHHHHSSPRLNGDNNKVNGLPNPTVIPTAILRRFHFAFLIRHPRRAIPSYFRCTVPPLDAVTGFSHFLSSEAGYDELRRLFDYLVDEGIVVKNDAAAAAATAAAAPGSSNGHGDNDDDLNKSTTKQNGNTTATAPDAPARITIIDADDLLDRPAEVVRAFCADVGLPFTPDMLRWDSDDDRTRAVGAFEKWKGFHEDALQSTHLKPRTHRAKIPTAAEEDAEWREKFGDEGQRVIRECVEANVSHYEYLKSFAMRF